MVRTPGAGQPLQETRMNDGCDCTAPGFAPVLKTIRVRCLCRYTALPFVICRQELLALH